MLETRKIRENLTKEECERLERYGSLTFKVDPPNGHAGRKVHPQPREALTRDGRLTGRLSGVTPTGGPRRGRHLAEALTTAKEGSFHHG